MRDRPLPDAVPGRIAVVGPCASGKSELVARLQALGYEARHCAQEHSYVPDMWQRLSRPQVLVYLDASLQSIAQRRRIDYDAAYLEEQRRRLAHARAHCHIYVDTDLLNLRGVLAAVLRGLRERDIRPAP
jgi:hypothetical protein